MIRFRTFLAIVTVFGLIVFLISRGPQQEFERTALPSVSRSDVEAPKFSRDVTAADTDEATPKVRPEMTAYYSQGVVHFDSGANDQTLQDYDEAVRLNPGYADAPYAEALVTGKPQAMPAATSSPPVAQALELVPRGVPVANHRSFAVHLASLRTQDRAKAEWHRLQREFPDLLRQRDMIIRFADLEERGTFYRVLTGPFNDRRKAQDLCAVFKSRQQYCLAVRLADTP